jgi:hypothetical protein
MEKKHEILIYQTLIKLLDCNLKILCMVCPQHECRKQMASLAWKARDAINQINNEND